MRYSAERLSSDGEPASFDATYRPAGDRFTAEAGSLEYFLTERYCLYTFDEGLQVYRTEIHHPPWPLQKGEAEIRVNTMARPFGMAFEEPPLLHYVGHQDVLVWRRRAIPTG